jgi:hypothetical protein
MVGGSQIDILAVETSDTGVSITTAAECKYFKGRVGVDEVVTFGKVLNDLRTSRLVDIGLMVTNVGFSTYAREKAETNRVQLYEIADLESRRDLNLAQASEPVGGAVQQARRMHRLTSDILGDDRPSVHEWDSVQQEVAKCVGRTRELADLHARTLRGSVLDRRAQAAIAQIADDSQRCQDAIWYLRQVLRLTSEADQLPPLPGGAADHTSATFMRLREFNAARSQVRLQFTKLDETCLRYTYPDRIGW